MIVQCTEEVIVQILDYCRMGHLAYLTIKVVDKELVADYILRDHLDSQDQISNVDNARRKSLATITKLMNELKDLQFILEEKVGIINYNLLYDCTKENVEFKIQKVFAKNNVKKQDIDFNELFKDKLDNKVPGIFIKVSSKKYTQITYKELIDILKSDK